MNKGQVVMKLQELKSKFWLESNNAMVYGKREEIVDNINELIELIDCDDDDDDTDDIMDMGLNELSIGED